MDITPGASPDLIDFILKLKLRVLAIEENSEQYPHKAMRKWARSMLNKYKSPWVRSLPNALMSHQFSYFEAQKMLATFKEITSDDVSIEITNSNGMQIAIKDKEPSSE